MVEKYFDLIDRFECDQIYILTDVIGGGVPVIPSLAGLKDFSRIKYLSFLGDYQKNKSSGVPIQELLQPFKNLEGLSLVGCNFGCELNVRFPYLKYCRLDRRCVKIRDIQDKFPALKSMCIDYLSDLSELGGHDSLETLFLYGAKLSDLEAVCEFKTLDTFYIEGQRRTLDVSVLNCLHRLETLGVDSTKFHLGWDKLKIDNIKNIFVSKIETTDVVDNNMSLEFFRVRKQPATVTQGALDKGWERYETSGYGFGGLALPKALLAGAR